MTKDATISELEGKIEDLESELTATKERGEKNMEEFSENIQGVRNAMAEELAAATGKAVTAEVRTFASLCRVGFPCCETRPASSCWLHT